MFLDADSSLLLCLSLIAPSLPCRASQDVIEEWATLQRKWLSLEPIFTAPDIARQLPTESKTFALSDASWKELMRRTHDDPNALRTSQRPGMKETLIRLNATLDAVQRGLDMYLEAKRGAFPRFYFISNDELIQVWFSSYPAQLRTKLRSILFVLTRRCVFCVQLLSRSKDHNVVQPHLRKCFDNIASLKVGESAVASLSGVAVEGMYSAEGEYVPFAQALKTRGQVEEWLTAVEDNMRVTLQVCVRVPLYKRACLDSDRFSSVCTRSAW